jgi:hypothetical protein
MNGLVASMKSIVLVQKASPGEILAKALNDASIEMRVFSETLRNGSVAERAKVLEVGHRFMAQNAVEHAELDVGDVRSKAIEAQQAFVRAELIAAKANADRENFSRQRRSARRRCPSARRQRSKRRRANSSSPSSMRGRRFCNVTLDANVWKVVLFQEIFGIDAPCTPSFGVDSVPGLKL